MNNVRYKKANHGQVKKRIKWSGLLLSIFSFFVLAYTVFPLLSWQIYFSQALASSDLTSPIPQTTIVSTSTIGSLFAQAADRISGVDDTNAKTWFPNFQTADSGNPAVPTYLLSIPKLGIDKAKVSTTGYDLAHYLVNYPGTGVPPDNGNAVVFGHSTLPQLFKPTDYKTIFANVYTLKVGDEVIATVSDIAYTYRIFSITVVDPKETSMFTQAKDDSYITLITCTPPGTTWRRLVLKARLEKI